MRSSLPLSWPAFPISLSRRLDRGIGDSELGHDRVGVRRWPLLRPSYRAHFAAVAAAAEERVATVRLESRHADAGRHVDLLQNLAGLRIDPAQFAFVGFPGAVPEFAVDPGHAGDEAVRLDGANDRPGLRIDLMNPAVAMLPNPERSFRPGHAGSAAIGRWNAGEHAAGLRIDLLDAIAGDLEQVLAVKGGSRMRGNIERAHRFPARGVDRVQRVAGRDPDMGPVIADTSDIRDIRKGAVFADDRCCRSFHVLVLFCCRSLDALTLATG